MGWICFIGGALLGLWLGFKWGLSSGESHIGQSFELGRQEGWQGRSHEDYRQGFGTGMQQGTMKGHTRGYKDGYDTGYRDGFQAGRGGTSFR